MSGKTWQGKMETDASSGVQRIQISVSILDGTTAIGSIVIGLNIKEL